MTPKIDRATWLFIKFDRVTWTLAIATYGDPKDSDKGQGPFLNSTWDKGNFKRQRHATLPFLNNEIRILTNGRGLYVLSTFMLYAILIRLSFSDMSSIIINPY